MLDLRTGDRGPYTFPSRLQSLDEGPRPCRPGTGTVDDATCTLVRGPLEVPHPCLKSDKTATDRTLGGLPPF